MWGWWRRARMLPSWRKRASPSRPTRLAFSSFTAAVPWNRPSLRSAYHTLPIPPWPMGAVSVYAPTVCPASVDGAGIGIGTEGP